MRNDILADFPQNIRTFLFVPLFNVDVDESLIGKGVYGFKIITSKQYFEEYRPLMIEEGWPQYTGELDRKVEIPKPGMIYRPVSSYIIVREISLPIEYDQQTAQEAQETIDKYVEMLIFFLIACRCLMAGNLQFNGYFVISKVAYYHGELPFVTAQRDIDKFKYSPLQKFYFCEHYHFSSQKILYLLRFSRKIYNVWDAMAIPLNYFMEYYSSSKGYERIIKLAIVWESSILNDCQSELEYRFKIRTSALLGENLSKVLSLAYKARSSIVHTGKLRKDDIKDLKKFLSTEETDGDILVYLLIRDHLEEITRQILQNFILQIYHKKKTLEETAKQIDQEIFEGFKKNN